MKRSISYHITILVIKLKGLKKDFSQDPINYRKIRKEDLHAPKGKFYRSDNVTTQKIADTTITEIKSTSPSSNLLIFIHGGAFISGPATHHWDSVQTISKKTDLTIWMCDYPKAPEHKISVISNNIDQVYKKALERFDAGHIQLIGDSVGATLITALTQRLVKKNMPLPKKIFLISPVMDASMSNPQIAEKDAIDPMLSTTGVLSAKRMCAENNNLQAPQLSPLFGSFENFPETVLFLAENDITYPDQQLAVQKLKDAQIVTEVIVGKRMPHIWPFLPVMKEAKVALNEIIKSLKSLKS